MLKLVIGNDWVSNRRWILKAIAGDVNKKCSNVVLLVPELISHDMERNLCREAGDSACRYAEVLSFSRLVRRVADSCGHGVVPCMDEGGRVVAMAAAVGQVHSKLKFFASVGTKPEFIIGLVETVDECKRCGVDADSLMQASRQATGVLAQKLEELSLIYQAYDGLCAHGKKDPRDQLTWLLEELEAGDYASEHTFYMDGFADFTRQQMNIVTHLMQFSKNVTISLNCDHPGTTSLAMERPGETATQLLRLARELGVQTQIEYVESDNNPLGQMACALFEGDIPDCSQLQLQVVRCESVHKECEAAAEYIQRLIHQGARYRDISLVSNDIQAYEGPLSMVFQRCGIPAYLSGTQSILDRPVITTVLSAIDAALSGFDRGQMLNYLKSALSPVTLQECDWIENYVLQWGIQGKKWTTPWQMHPKGLVDVWSDADREFLAQLNGIRKRVMDPLTLLREQLTKGANTADQTRALYDFLESVGLAKRLSELADRLECSGDQRNAQILDQLWEILVNALEQMHDVLARTSLEPEVFARLFKVLLSRYDVGTIPTVLDAVTVGSVDAMRCKQAAHLLVLGAVEGALPGYASASGVLTDQDRTALRDMGVPLNGGAEETLQTAFSEIYGVFRGVSHSVYVSCPGSQPSFVYHRLKEMSGKEINAEQVLGAAVCNAKQAAAYLLRADNVTAAEQLQISGEYDAIAKKRDYVYGYISAQQVEKLYGSKFRLSASQIDVHANCAMSYFLKYGLRAKERKPAQIDPAEFGTFVHDVLEKTARQIVDRGGFRSVSREDALQISGNYAKEYIQNHFADLDSERLTYLLNRNGKELELIVEELWNELHNSGFSPVMFEMSFGGDQEGLPAIQIQGNHAAALLRGFVDRVDMWECGEHTYFRVVDYKTGLKSFDYCDVINGIGLQMLLYLFALEQSNSPILGQEPIPAGVQYFPARAPVVTVESASDEGEIIKEREKCWKRSGLLLDEEPVLSAMEPEGMSGRMPFKRKKDGTLTGDLADRRQFSLLRQFIYRHLKTMVDDIASGNVTANPYTRDARKNACRFCPYGQICHKKDVQGRRVFKAITAQRFWDDVVKKVEHNG